MTAVSPGRWARAGMVAAVALTAVVSAHAQEAGGPPFPRAVVDSLAERGREIYGGSARCAVCHGEEGRGTEDGPDLTDRKWLRGSGTYEEILGMVRHGVSRREAETGRPMPIRGWVPVDDSAAEAVAVYVWALSHGGARR